jgi:hypothetical protein
MNRLRIFAVPARCHGQHRGGADYDCANLPVRPATAWRANSIAAKLGNIYVNHIPQKLHANGSSRRYSAGTAYARRFAH